MPGTKLAEGSATQFPSPAQAKQERPRRGKCYCASRGPEYHFCQLVEEQEESYRAWGQSSF